MKDKKLLYVVNSPEFFLSHRAPLAKAAKDNGYSVHVATSKGEAAQEIVRLGFIFHEVSFSRSGQNPFTELKTVLMLKALFEQLRPDLIHLVTIKPMLYGGFVNRLTINAPLVGAVSGLGTVFTSTSVLGRLRRFIIKRVYSFALSCKLVKVIFQNPDDRSALLNSGVISPDNSILIRGSGVDLTEYKSTPEPERDKVQVVMAARLLIEKGVHEFYRAAKLLKSRGTAVEMKLIGTPDSGNPKSLSEWEFELWKSESFINVLGFRCDIAEQYADANIVCLPSYYGEGLPKSLIEAAACGRAIITTNSPGCNYAVEDGVTGILIPSKNHVALADAIEKLVKDAKKRSQMGKAGRAFAEKHFDINVVVKQHLDIYRDLLSHG